MLTRRIMGIGMSLMVATGLVGCSGGDDPAPVTQVTVTVLKAGVPMVGEPAVMSSDVDLGRAIAIGVLETKATDAAGKATFTVPISTSTGYLCFSSRYVQASQSTSIISFRQTCASLNILDATLVFDHAAPGAVAPQ